MSQPSKQITLTDLAELFVLVAHQNGSIHAEDADLSKLTEDLARVACKHFGGEVSPAGASDEMGEPMVTVRRDHRVPKDGGIWAELDTESDGWLGSDVK